MYSKGSEELRKKGTLSAILSSLNPIIRDSNNSMDCTVTSIPYQQIGYFSKIIIDYLNGTPDLQPFYSHPVSLEGLRQAIESRKQFPSDRKLLVDVLQKQYAPVNPCGTVKKNIESLLTDDSFTIVTAHQPNI